MFVVNSNRDKNINSEKYNFYIQRRLNRYKTMIHLYKSKNNFKNMLNWEKSWYNFEYEKYVTRDKNRLSKYGYDYFVDWYEELYSKIYSVKLINENWSSLFYVNCFNSETNFIELIN